MDLTITETLKRFDKLSLALCHCSVGADRIIGASCTLQVTSENKAMRHRTRSLSTWDIVLYCCIDTLM